jgi:hypothetical protein
MKIAPELKRNIQVALLIALVVAGLRTGWILYQRYDANRKEQLKQQAAPPPLNPDYYVTPKKLHAYDMKSARELTQQPAWVKEGYRYTYYLYDGARHQADFNREAGLLQPLQKLDIKDVVINSSPAARDQKQVMAVFEKENKSYAVPIGVLRGSDDYKIYADEMLFVQDPKELYKHWPAEVWEAIDKHEVKAGMNELQVDFAVGMGVPEKSDDSDSKLVKYPNGGKPLSVTYRDGKAVEVKPGA